MGDYDRDLVAAVAGAVSAYVSDAEPEDVAIEVLTDLEAEGWQLSHPNDTDGGSYEPTEAPVTDDDVAPSAAMPWDFFRYRRRDPGD